MAVIFGEIEIVLDKRSTGQSVIADAVATHPRVQKRKRAKEETKKPALRFARVARGRCADVLLVHERGTRRKRSLFPATIITGSITISSQSPRRRKGPGKRKLSRPYCSARFYVGARYPRG